MRKQMLACLILCGFLAVLACDAQTAPDPLTQEDYKVIANSGVALDSKMVTELTPVDRDKLKQIIKDKPADEVKKFLVTRRVIRRIAASGPNWPELNAAEISEIQQNFKFSYCYNFQEQLDSFTWLMHYNITLSESPHS
jgi:hypothetical protein